MAYKYEIEKKASSVKIRVLIAVYVMFVVSSILIGVAVRLQQLQNVRPIDPKADTAGNPSAAAISIAGDPTYDVKKLMALAYCDVVNAQGQSTGVTLPLAARFNFRQIQRDVGQRGTPLASVCSSATPGSCPWNVINDESYMCLNGQTTAQCNPSDFYSCEDNAIPGALYYSNTVLDSSASSVTVSFPGDTQQLGNLVHDDNEIDIILNQNSLDLSSNTLVRNGVTYTINKQSLSTVDTASLFPIYQWRCNNDNCLATGTCTNGSLTYTDSPCTFDSTQRRFINCPTNKYARYDVLLDHKTFYYNITDRAGQVAANPSWVKVGYAYDSFVDGTYANSLPTGTQDPISFRGNVVKFRYTCTASNVTTTPTVTPDTEISAEKRGPACVERVAPNNQAVFTITVRNSAATATVISRVEDALPQGFVYAAGTTIVNGAAVPDSYVTTVNSGTSQRVTFAPPATVSPWTLNSQQVMTITFTATATANAVTGVNTNRVVVVPEGDDAIDNITWQFEVAHTCNPETGIMDDPKIVFAISGVLILFGMFLLYVPTGRRMLHTFGRMGKKMQRNLQKSVEVPRKAAKKEFEQNVLRRKK
jgi:uncharacterized repeat protein (TIGR01451 family)